MHAFRAFFTRELQSVLLSRLLIGFAVVSVAVGLLPVGAGTGEAGERAPLYLLQITLYLVPLFGILIGTNAALGDLAEADLLLSQPFSAPVRLAAKCTASFCVLGAVVCLLFLPSLLVGGSRSIVSVIAASGLGVLAVFLFLGLCIGFRIHDPVKAHMVSLVAWLLLVFGLDLLSLGLLQLPWVRENPALWTVMLMANPLDALRIGALFGIQAVPFALESVPPLTRWWLSHPHLWMALISLFWLAAGFSFAIRWSERIEE